MTAPVPPENNKQPPQKAYQPIRPAQPTNNPPPPANQQPAPRSGQPPAGSFNPQQYAPPPPPAKMINAGEFEAAPARRPRKTGQRSRQKAERTIGNLPLNLVAGYAGLAVLVLVILVGAFVGTRIFNFLGNISVDRVDTAGNKITGSSVTGKGRVNIVLLGLDRRQNDSEGTRSDSMLIVSIDQDNQTANMLSIPRDLWVKIPGYGNRKINAAYFLGDQSQPGRGGPPLVKDTLRENFGVRVDYFVEIDFNGFRQIIDSLGGITIDVKKPLVDNEYPTEDFGYKRIHIPAGLQRMNGDTALEYARSRHADSDFGRNQRQQEVLLAVREQGINLGLLTNIQLQNALIGTVKTDLTPGDILGLGRIAATMRRDSIRQFSIDANLTQIQNIDNTEAVVIADQAGFARLWEQFLAAAPAANPANSGNQANPTPQPERAKINVLNGTFTEGRAARTQKFLESKGLIIGTVGQAGDAGNYPRTVINVYTGKQQTANQIAGLLGIPTDRIRAKSGGPAGVDIEVICGDDLKLPE